MPRKCGCGNQTMEKIGRKGGNDVWKCSSCGRENIVLVNGPRPSSIRAMLKTIRRIVPKIALENIDPEKIRNNITYREGELDIRSILRPRKTDIIEECMRQEGRREGGPTSWEGCANAFEWWLDDGLVDGRLTPVRYDGHFYIRTPVDGDPELVSPIFECTVAGCRKAWNVDDLADGCEFPCDCGQLYEKNGPEIIPTLRIKLEKEWGLIKNHLRLTLENKENRIAHYILTLLKNGKDILEESLDCPPGQEMILKVESSSRDRWHYGDKFQAELRDNGNGKFYISEEVKWWDPPILRGVVALGLPAAIITRNPIITLISGGIGAVAELWFKS